jgi:hypothetical protein
VDRVNEAFQQIAENMDEEEILRRVQGGRLRIGLTDSGYFPFFRGNQQEAYVFVDEFENLQEILAACILSSYVPGLTGPAPLARSFQIHPAVLQANKCLKEMVERGAVKDRKGSRRERLHKETSELWDGGLVNLFPTINKESILVTPFAGTFKNPTISPMMVAGAPQELPTGFTTPKIAFPVNSYSSVDVSMENLRTLRYMALSSTDDALQTWFAQGYDTCQLFLSNNNMQSNFSIALPHLKNNIDNKINSTPSAGERRSFHTITTSWTSGHNGTVEKETARQGRKRRRPCFSENSISDDPPRAHVSDRKPSTTSNMFGNVKYAFAVVAMILWWVPCMALDEFKVIKSSGNETEIFEGNELSLDSALDSFLDPLSPDPSCLDDNQADCYAPPKSTIEQESIEVAKWDATCFKGGDDIPEEEEQDGDSFEMDVKKPSNQCIPRNESRTETVRVDKHWGNDPAVLRMRDLLLNRSLDTLNDSRPPIFLLPGLASTRLGKLKQ